MRVSAEKMRKNEEERVERKKWQRGWERHAGKWCVFKDMSVFPGVSVSLGITCCTICNSRNYGLSESVSGHCWTQKKKPLRSTSWVTEKDSIPWIGVTAPMCCPDSRVFLCVWPVEIRQSPLSSEWTSATCHCGSWRAEEEAWGKGVAPEGDLWVTYVSVSMGIFILT